MATRDDLLNRLRDYDANLAAEKARILEEARIAAEYRAAAEERANIITRTVNGLSLPNAVLHRVINGDQIILTFRYGEKQSILKQWWIPFILQRDMNGQIDPLKGMEQETTPESVYDEIIASINILEGKVDDPMIVLPPDDQPKATAFVGMQNQLEDEYNPLDRT